MQGRSRVVGLTRVPRLRKVSVTKALPIPHCRHTTSRGLMSTARKGSRGSKSALGPCVGGSRTPHETHGHALPLRRRSSGGRG